MQRTFRYPPWQCQHSLFPAVQSLVVRVKPVDNRFNPSSQREVIDWRNKHRRIGFEQAGVQEFHIVRMKYALPVFTAFITADARMHAEHFMPRIGRSAVESVRKRCRCVVLLCALPVITATFILPASYVGKHKPNLAGTTHRSKPCLRTTVRFIFVRRVF